MAMVRELPWPCRLAFLFSADTAIIELCASCPSLENVAVTIDPSAGSGSHLVGFRRSAKGSGSLLVRFLSRLPELREACHLSRGS